MNAGSQLAHPSCLLILTDALGTIREAHATAGRSFGDVSGLVGQQFADLLADDELDAVGARLDPAAGPSPADRSPFAVTLRALDGRRVPFEVLAQRVPCDGGGWVLALGADGAVAHVLLDTGGQTPQVVAGERSRPLTAALTVLVDAGNDRLWRDVRAGTIRTSAIEHFPEVLRVAAELEGLNVAHVGSLAVGDGGRCVVLWFTADARRGAPRGRSQVNPERTARAAVVAVPLPPVPVVAVTPVSDVDPLTGLLTRSAFDHALDELDSLEATVLIIDLDHFARINDEHGCDVGNQVLIEVADRLRAICRAEDVIARLDSDRFAILLADVDRSTALGVSRRLLGEIGEPLPAGLGPSTLSASVGLAHQFGALDPRELFESADQAMHSGKRSGRGRVVIAAI